MSTVTVAATVGVTNKDGTVNLTHMPVSQDPTTLAAAIATAVAAGASPTQAQVSAINTAYAAFSSAIGADATLAFNPATVLTKKAAKQILAAFAVKIDSGYFNLS